MNLSPEESAAIESLIYTIRKFSSGKFWGQVTLFFEEGRVRDHFEVHATFRRKDRSQADHRRSIDAALDELDPSSPAGT